MSEAECAAIDIQNRDKCEASLVSRDGKPLAVAPMTEGGALMSGAGKAVQTEEAIHVGDFSTDGLVDLFRSPLNDVDGIKVGFRV